MSLAIKRIALVGLIQLVLFEVLMQLAVSWRESSEELGTMALFLGSAIACLWAAFPAVPRSASRFAKLGLRGGLAATWFVALYAMVFLYSWEVRPHMGYYREPDWVKEHPDFQRQLHERIGHTG